MLFNAGLDDINNRFSSTLSVHNCSHAREERKQYLDQEIRHLFQWAEGMSDVTHFTYRSTTPARATPNPKILKVKNCWGKDCAHMNQLIKIVNDKMSDQYKQNSSTQVHFLDAWALLGGFCTSEVCKADGHMRCYTSRYTEYDDFYHSSYLAYVQLGPWLENVCQKNRTSALGSYLT